ncbi:MAG: hypothetical protein M1812_000103 [Candelaria pacifica]|nr:MAG: hypothetical protein M1812_000103 [Candelaria pacifica]
MPGATDRLMQNCLAGLSQLSSPTMAASGRDRSSNDSDYFESHVEIPIGSEEAKVNNPEPPKQWTSSDQSEDLIDFGHEQNNHLSLPSAHDLGSKSNGPVPALPGTKHGESLQDPATTASKESQYATLNTQTGTDTSWAPLREGSRETPTVPAEEVVKVPTWNNSSSSVFIGGKVSNDSYSTVRASFSRTNPRPAQIEVIRIPKAEKIPPTRTYPPGISFVDVPQEAKVQDILSLIRKTPDCRIRLVNLKHKEKAGKLFFVGWPAHEVFINDARSGHLKSIWDVDVNISVDENDVFNPTIDGESLESATRILRIRNLPERVTLDIVLEDLVRASPGWMFCIEKAILFKTGEDLDDLTVQLNFTSIRGAVMARDCLEKDPDNVTKYEFTETVFAADECSSEYDPPPTIGIVDWRGYTKASRLPVYLLPNGYVRLPRIGPKPEPLHPTPTQFMPSQPIPPASTPTPASTGNAGPIKMHPSPPKYPPYGIHIKGLPNDITYSTLLSVVRGGKVLQANIFNPKPKNEGEVRGAAVFFVEKEDADKVLGFLTNKGGLLVPDAGDGPGKRYVATRYVNNLTWQQPAMPPFASRSVSLLIEDKSANKKFTTAKVWDTMIHDISIPMEAETMWETTYIKSPPNAMPIPMRRLVFTLLSIEMATAAFQLLKNMGNVEGRHVARYEHDPCVGSVYEMA